MKYYLTQQMHAEFGHSPHGECGLKFAQAELRVHLLRSLPAWGVRVEIWTLATVEGLEASLPAWGVRVEITRRDRKSTRLNSSHD